MIKKKISFNVSEVASEEHAGIGTFTQVTDLYCDAMQAFSHENVDKVSRQVVLDAQNYTDIVCWDLPLGSEGNTSELCVNVQLTVTRPRVETHSKELGNSTAKSLHYEDMQCGSLP